jgi:hypothetical protein
MRHLSILFFVFALSACATNGKLDEKPIPTTATGTVTIVATNTATFTTTSTSTAPLSGTSADLLTSTTTSVSTAISAVPVQDVIAGQVVGEEPMMEVSKHANVRLLHGGTELANITAETNGNFRFEGNFPKGRYEISVRDGKLHGAREISFGGGDLTGMNVLVTDGKGDHRHRRRHHH